MAEPGFLRSELLTSIGITAIFSERSGGISPEPFSSLNLGHNIGDSSGNVEANMAKLVRVAELSGRPHQTEQVHGVEYFICSGTGSLHSEQADILISSQPDTPIAVRTADCLPILMADPVNRIVAAVHAGWRGTAAGVVIAAVEQMLQMGARQEHIHASLGPSIGSCCFEVGDDTAETLKKGVAGAEKAIKYSPQPHPDLAAINLLCLKEAGVREDHIETFPICTCCHPERFYSYRRDHGVTGRHLAVVALPEAP
ncbi:MAG: peptidoglycan editing factor PgeF [Mariprofundaceae bacterium]|nr:peptidoglycan editing factor PgeF [Mariprofundaceae bacterium]